MKLNRISWTTFFLLSLSLISLAVWLKFNYPQLTFTNFSVDRTQAVAIAQEHLRANGYADPGEFQAVAVFNMDELMDRYMQKTVGFDGLSRFIKEHDFDLFYWRVRFFKEKEKEGFNYIIDSAKGEITGYSHALEDTAARGTIEREEARAQAEAFLTKTFGFDPARYSLGSDLATIRDNRTDYFFSWYKQGVSIPWSALPDSGTGKLIKSVLLTGDEILGFSKNSFLVPEQFNRDLDGRKEWSRNMLLGIRMIILALLTSGIYLILVRQNHLAMHATKKFYFGIMLFSFLLSLTTFFNQFEEILYSYTTTSSLQSFLWRSGINTVIAALFTTVTMLIPGLAGELLHAEASPNQPSGSFRHYIQSTFASRSVSEMIALGYFVCFIMLGIQSLLVKTGQTYLGVWVEYNWVNNFTTAFLPFLAAFTFGFKTSFSEEIMYRLYAINLGKKIFSKFLPGKPGPVLIITCLLSSLIWGYAHSGYQIFPMWFRGLEVSCLGLFLSFIYLKYGIIPVIVAHYLFDVFWNCAGFIFGTSKPFYFYSSIGILLLPLMLAAAAFVLNRKETVRPLRWQLNKHQLYNVEVLKAYLNQHQSQFALKSPEQIKGEITSHGWDPAVADVALEGFLGKNIRN